VRPSCGGEEGDHTADPSRKPCKVESPYQGADISEQRLEALYSPDKLPRNVSGWLVTFSNRTDTARSGFHIRELPYRPAGRYLMVEEVVR